MPNYNDNNTRDNSIDQLPRMIFQLPNAESGATSPSVNPVFFCQSGCAIEYTFSNIRSCQFNNDGKKFTITPTDRTNINYIKWNGTDINSGEKMVQYTLKEVYFTAPAKDYLGTNTDFLSQSIQIFFVFVNEQYNNLMICVSVIGSVNNLGNAPKSNGFVMMETLARRIPSVNVQSQLNNLNNFNLGTLIPANKPFFSTLITNNIQYIELTEIIDVPIEFFSNIASMVNGGTQLYNAKMNQYRTNIPQNPSTTILFYNENSQVLNDNQNFVCNSNCDLVPGKKITPTIGTYTTTQSSKKPARPQRTISGAELPPEKCETKKVWANQSTKPKTVKDSSGGPSGPSGTDSINGHKDNTNAIAITVSLLIAMVIIIVVCSYYKYKKYGFSIKLIVAGIIGIIVTVVGLSVGCHLYVEEKDLHWLSYVLGACGFFGAMVFIVIINNSDSYRYNTSYPSFNSNTPLYMNKKQPYSGITVPTGFNQPKTSWFGKMFSSSSHSKPMTDYSPQITVPSVSNTQSKQSFATAPQITVPQSSAAVSSSTPVPQSSTAVYPQKSKSLISKVKNMFSKKTDSSSTASSAPPPIIANPIINKVSDLMKRISAQPNNKINSNKKRTLINKLNRISKNPSSSSLQLLNEISSELNR